MSTGDVEESLDVLTVERVTQIATAAHRMGQAEKAAHSEDTLTELRDSFDARMRLGGSRGGVLRTSSLHRHRAGVERSQSLRDSASSGVRRPPLARHDSAGLTRSLHRRPTRKAPQRSHSAMVGSSRMMGAPRARSGTADLAIMAAHRRDPLSRSAHEMSLRGASRDQLVNTPVSRKDSDLSILSQMTDSTAGLGSEMTMDSINLRKEQMIADPLDLLDGEYDDECSYACHDSVSRFSGDYLATYSEHLPGSVCGGSVSTWGTIDSVNVRRVQIHDHQDEEPEHEESFSSLGDDFGEEEEALSDIEEKSMD